MKNHTIAIKGYIACLGLWNEGLDRGRWIDFPISSDELAEVLADIGCNAEHEEYFFPDWESPVKFGEYEYDIDRINDIAERLAGLDEDADIIEAILNEYSHDIEAGLSILENENYTFYDNCDDMEDVARQVIADLNCPGCDRSKDIDLLLRYFDYEAYGRDLEILGNYIPAAGGYIELY